jgi:hypothetical protein
MTWVARSWFSLLLLASVLAVPFGLIAQDLPHTQTASSPQSSAEPLQQLLDRDDDLAEHMNVFHGPHQSQLSLLALVASTKSPRLELAMSRCLSAAKLSRSMALTS